MKFLTFVATAVLSANAIADAPPPVGIEAKAKVLHCEAITPCPSGIYNAQLSCAQVNPEHVLPNLVLLEITSDPTLVAHNRKPTEDEIKKYTPSILWKKGLRFTSLMYSNSGITCDKLAANVSIGPIAAPGAIQGRLRLSTILLREGNIKNQMGQASRFHQD